MAKQIARLLKTDIMADLDLPGIAQLLESKGRKGDTMLAHITPQEAALLKARGGAGTTNPDTGLPEFYDGSFRISDYADFDAPDIQTGGYKTRAQPIDVEQESYRLSPNVPVGDFSDTRPERMNYSLAPIDFSEQRPTGIYRGGELTSLYSPETVGLAPFQPQEISTVPSPVPPAQPGFLERTADYFKRPETLEKLGLAGLQALPGILQAREARKQGQRAKEEMQRLGAPYQQQGQALVAQAQRGELTAPGQQQIQALQARAAQGVAARGGVGAEQAAAQVEAFRQQLLQGQYDMGLKVANIGDQIAAGAIRTGLSADQYVNELTNDYFTNMARTLYGTPQTGQTQTPR